MAVIHAPSCEFGDEDDEQGDAGGDGADAVDDHAAAGAAGRRWRIQCMTMPAWERVKARKAPMA